MLLVSDTLDETVTVEEDVNDAVRVCVDVCVGVRELLGVHEGLRLKEGVTVPVIVGSSPLSQQAYRR